MRKIILALAALAAVGIAMPVVSNSASAETVVIKKSRHHDWHPWRHHRERVIIREHRRHHDGRGGHRPLGPRGMQKSGLPVGGRFSFCPSG